MQSTRVFCWSFSSQKSNQTPTRGAVASVSIMKSVVYYDGLVKKTIDYQDKATRLGAIDGYLNAMVTSISIPDWVTSIENEAFYYSNLVYCEIPSSVHYLGNKCFSGSAIESIIIPPSITVIPEFCFCHASSLTTVVIPDSVTHIMQYAFAGCQSLTNISIPEYVAVYNNVFEFCPLLEAKSSSFNMSVIDYLRED